jgi:hypothetical protein
MQAPELLQQSLQQKRKRGGQPGNTNRLRHGLYSRAHLARRDEGRALRRKTRRLIAKLGMVARARAALRRKLLSPPCCREVEGRRAASRVVWGMSAQGGRQNFPRPRRTARHRLRGMIGATT